MLHIMRTEAQGWRNSKISSALSSQTTYSGGKFANLPILKQTDANGWSTWTQIFSEPVDVRLSPTGNARYCAYTRGGYLDQKSDSGVFKVHIAVIYPGSNKSFPDGECFGSDNSLIKDKLNPSLPPAETDGIQMNGYRANFFGGVITRRSYLP